jgi:serine/threonine-protein kinase
MFGPYELHECLGMGGMASVHRATIELADGARREVALKRLLPHLANDRGFVEDFIREAKLVAGLEHPHIAKLLELGSFDDTYYIVMELVKGAPLLALMRGAHVQKRPAPVGVVLALISELCDALDYASNGTDAFGEPLRIVHRDLSPSNLMITDQGVLKVIDFGVAKSLGGHRLETDSGLVKGKLGYMAPESLSDEPIDPRADLFSAGVVAWELLAARRLFKADTQDATIEKLRTLPIPPPSHYNPRCSPALDSVILRALARPTQDRWVTAAAMREAIEDARRDCGEPSTARAVTDWVRATQMGRKPTEFGVAPAPPERDSMPSLPRLATSDAMIATPKRFRLLTQGWRSVTPTSVYDDDSKVIEIGTIEQVRVRIIEDASKRIEISTVENTAQRTVRALDDFDAQTTASRAPRWRGDD